MNLAEAIYTAALEALGPDADYKALAAALDRKPTQVLAWRRSKSMTTTTIARFVKVIREASGANVLLTCDAGGWQCRVYGGEA